MPYAKLKGGSSLSLPSITHSVMTPFINYNNHKNKAMQNMVSMNRNKSAEANILIINEIITKITRMYIENKSVDTFKATKDYKKYGLFPGQQIAYGGGFGISFLKHYGVYIGDGFVYELAPQSENKSLRYGPKIAVGISTLQNFVERANHFSFYTFSSSEPGYENDNKINVSKRLYRILEYARITKSRANQLILSGNCEHIANDITYGNYTSKQSDIATGVIIIGILIWKGTKFNKQQIPNIGDEALEIFECQKRHITEDNCVCYTKPTSSLSSLYRSPECEIDPEISCKFPQKKHPYTRKVRKGTERLKLTVRRKSNRRKKRHNISYKWIKC